MKTKKLNLIFKLAILTIAILGLSTCNSSKKSTTSADTFKIPKKIVKAEDLPQQVQEKEQNPVRYVQLYPEEKPLEKTAIAETVKPEEGIVTNTIKNEPEKENIVVSKEMTEIEKHVDDVVQNIVQNKTRTMYYHIVSGSFKNKIYAEMFANHLKKIGYGNTYIKFFDNGFNRVIVQRYNNEVEARQYLQGYRADNPLYADAWLFYNKDFNDEPLAFNSN
jgi:cell division protein FtsN